MNNTKIITCGAKARVGKDLLCDFLKKLLEEKGFKVEKRSLATPLKEMTDEFLIKNIGISAFTQDEKEKKLIRPFLVETGKMLRIKTQGRFFTQKLDDWLAGNIDLDFVLVPDCRYAEYEQDEVFYFKKRGAFIINIDRWVKFGFIEPANKEEEENAPKIAKAADYHLIWGDKDQEEKAREVFEKILEFRERL